MSSYESFVLLLSTIIIICFLKLLRYKNSQILILATACTIPLYISTVKLTQFLTTDENLTVHETVFLHQVPIEKAESQWGLGGFRFSFATIGVLYNIFSKGTWQTALAELGTQNSTISLWYSAICILKSLHYLVGLVLVLLIYYLLESYFISKDLKSHRSFFFVMYMYSILLLPVNIVGFKVFNYDLYSMLLFVLSMLLSFTSLKKNSWKLCSISLTIAVLALEEKLTASPILPLVMALNCYLFIQKFKKPVYALVAGMINLSVYYAVVLMTFFSVMVVRNFNASFLSLSSINFSLVSWGFPFIRLINNDFRQFSKYTVILVVITILSTTVIGFVAYLTTRTKYLGLMDKRIRIQKKYLLSAVACLLIFSLYGTYFVKAHLAPLRPVPAGIYDPHSPLFNSAYIYFDASSKFEYIFKHIAWSYAVFFNALPSVFIVLLLLLVACLYITKNKDNVSLLDISMFIALLFPLLSALTKSPIANRYFNIFLVILVINILYNVYKYFVTILPKNKNIAFSVLLCAGLIAEIWPFKPLYGAFRPIWSEPSNRYKNSYEVGEPDISWTGWGEEMMIVGERIWAKCKLDNSCKDTRIFFNFAGKWNLMANGIYIPLHFKYVNTFIPTSEQAGGYDENDYFIVNRSALISKVPKNFPNDMVPYDTVNYRGYIQAWVFRGDQLNEKNFSF